MHELTYKSIARPEITSKEVNDILEIAKLKNMDRNISGCLVYHNGVFIQIIEGEEKEVLELFETIKLDIRHSEVELLWEGSSQGRVFSDWVMAYYSVGDRASIVEIKEFEKNLLLFSKLSEKPTASTNLFWKNVNLLLESTTPLKALVR